MTPFGLYPAFLLLELIQQLLDSAADEIFNEDALTGCIRLHAALQGSRNGHRDLNRFRCFSVHVV